MTEQEIVRADEVRRGNPAWLPGVSGNPAGRPKGSRNRATLLLEAMMEDDAEAIGRAVVALARTGNLAALRLCLDRLAPRGRHRRAAFALPRVDSAADAARASDALLQAVADGDLSPAEAGELSRVIETALRALQAAEEGRA